jgi:hypothetical protein
LEILVRKESKMDLQRMRTRYGTVSVLISKNEASENEENVSIILNEPVTLNGVVINEAKASDLSEKAARHSLTKVIENAARYNRDISHKKASAKVSYS